MQDSKVAKNEPRLMFHVGMLAPPWQSKCWQKTKCANPPLCQYSFSIGRTLRFNVVQSFVFLTRGEIKCDLALFGLFTLSSPVLTILSNHPMNHTPIETHFMLPEMLHIKWTTTELMTYKKDLKFEMWQ